MDPEGREDTRGPERARRGPQFPVGDQPDVDFEDDDRRGKGSRDEELKLPVSGEVAPPGDEVDAPGEEGKGCEQPDEHHVHAEARPRAEEAIDPGGNRDIGKHGRWEETGGGGGLQSNLEEGWAKLAGGRAGVTGRKGAGRTLASLSV